MSYMICDMTDFAETTKEICYVCKKVWCFWCVDCGRLQKNKIKNSDKIERKEERKGGRRRRRKKVRQRPVELVWLG